MASNRRPTISSPTPHFAKVLKSSQDTKLRIPKEFVTKYGDDLSSRVYLSVPNGAEWEVKIKRRDGDVWFQKGSWSEFCLFYGVDNTNLLVFRYEGNSEFQVSILDSSGTEIKYPIPSSEDEDEEAEEEDEDEEDGDEDDEKSTEISWEDFEPSPLPRMKNKEKSSVSLYSLANREVNFVSNFPFFKVTLGHSLKTYVPAAFKWKHLRFQGSVHISLFAGDKSWPVRLFDRCSNCEFGAGWGAFKREHHLKHGDICIFELINQRNVTMNVHIFRR